MPEWTEVDFEAAGVVELTAATWRQHMSGPGVVLVSFGAPWCSYCRRLDPVLTELATAYNTRAGIAKLNTDQARELARQHKVRGLPQLVLFKGGREVDRMPAGFHTIASIMTMLDRHLEPTEETELRRQVMMMEANQDGVDSGSDADAYRLQAEVLGKLEDYAGRWITPKRDRQLLTAAGQILRQEKYLSVFEEMSQIVRRRSIGDTPDECGVGIAMLEARLGVVGFDPLIVSAIVAAIMMLFDLCPFAKARDVRNLPRRKLARQIKEKAPGLGWVDALRHADETIKLAREATDEELNRLISDCCS